MTAKLSAPWKRKWSGNSCV